jgi:hypothetical protein
MGIVLILLFVLCCNGLLVVLQCPPILFATEINSITYTEIQIEQQNKITIRQYIGCDNSNCTKYDLVASITSESIVWDHDIQENVVLYFGPPFQIYFNPLTFKVTKKLKTFILEKMNRTPQIFAGQPLSFAIEMGEFAEIVFDKEVSVLKKIVLERNEFGVNCIVKYVLFDVIDLYDS